MVAITHHATHGSRLLPARLLHRMTFGTSTSWRWISNCCVTVWKSASGGPWRRVVSACKYVSFSFRLVWQHHLDQAPEAPATERAEVSKGHLVIVAPAAAAAPQLAIGSDTAPAAVVPGHGDYCDSHSDIDGDDTACDICSVMYEEDVQFPFDSCPECKDSPSYHHARCCVWSPEEQQHMLREQQHKLRRRMQQSRVTPSAAGGSTGKLVCEHCQLCHPGETFPLDACWFCGDEASKHQGRCCPQRHGS